MNNKNFPQKSISGRNFLCGNLATGHFLGKFFSHCTLSGHTGLPEAESITGHTDTNGQNKDIMYLY